jgi:hypothetical protein
MVVFKSNLTELFFISQADVMCIVKLCYSYKSLYQDEIKVLYCSRRRVWTSNPLFVWCLADPLQPILCKIFPGKFNFCIHTCFTLFSGFILSKMANITSICDMQMNLTTW